MYKRSGGIEHHQLGPTSRRRLDTLVLMSWYVFLSDRKSRKKAAMVTH